MMKRHALFVGVNDYADPTIQDLAFPTEDATELTSVFRRLLKFDRVEKLTNPAHSPEVVDAVSDMTRGLGPGDLFLFFFAGHGFRVKDNHVLVCAKDEFVDLEDEYAGLSVGRLKKRMRGPWNRMLVLDACQNDIRTTRGADSGVAARDLGLIHALDDGVPGAGHQIVITACSEGQRALEVADLGHGLFTSAFLDSVTAFADARRRIDLESLRTDLGVRMGQLIAKYRLSGRQEPMFTMPTDAGGVILLDGVVSKASAGIPPSANRPAAAPRVVCPSCGFRNLEEQTFRCRICGRDYLCKRHYDESGNCCRDCAAGATTKMVQLWKGGPYWATTNIGAENPEEYGYYFWWGDTIGCKFEDGVWVASDGSSADFRFGDNPVSKETFDMSLLVLLAGGWITGAKSPSSSFSLEPEHDAAHVQWGGEWRMPTGRELGSLCSKCDWIWTSMNGVNGYVVRGRGDYASASIFLPANFRGDGSSSSDVGSYGSYWSSSTEDDDSCSLYFNSSERGTKGWFRYAGKSIRPVRDFDKGGAVSTSGTDAAENGVSQAKRENLSGDAVIDGSFSDNITVGPGRRLEIKGSCSGNVRICRRSVLVCRGSCSGNVDIEHEGRFECYGPMSGNITNHRGTVDIHGPFTGTRRDV